MSEVNVIELVDLNEQQTKSNPLEHVVMCAECMHFRDDDSCYVNFGVVHADDDICGMFDQKTVKCLDCNTDINYNTAPSHECDT